MIDRTANFALSGLYPDIYYLFIYLFILSRYLLISLVNHMIHQFLAPWAPLGAHINWAALLTPLVLVQL